MLQENSDPSDLWVKLWRIKLPPKILFFLWKYHHRVIPTRGFLAIRIPNSGISDACGWCGMVSESVDHLFFECEVASWTWSFISQWWQIKITLKNQIEFTDGPFSRFRGSPLKKVWKLILSVEIWTIWLSRNENLFQNKRISKYDLHKILIVRSFQWCLAYDWLSES